MDRTDTATRSSRRENAEDFLDRMTGFAGGTGGFFLDRINRIFKIRGFLGFCLSWFAAFVSR
jgi:hypothetical protein